MLKQEIILMIYNKDVLCIIDKDAPPICKQVQRLDRRSGIDVNKDIPSHDPYIPRVNPINYNCSKLECNVVTLSSITQVTAPSIDLKACYKQADDYQCEPIRYKHFITVDKLLFLANNIPTKSFYTVDCLLYQDGGRVCHKKDSADSHAKLVDTGTIARPEEPNVLSQDEYICEESKDKIINCDLDSFVPFEDGLRLKESVKPAEKILLKSGSYVVILKRNCIENWCGYSGKVESGRRTNNLAYDPPGGKTFKCYYAKKQQICKELYSPIGRSVYNDRDWVCACSALAALDGYSPQQDPDQFHIQTDGDEDRYFIYQTHNGQYRKERRLKDGSVVGTTGWVGADGYLRLQDYIADSQGYRIYKSKTVYVGENRPISESLNIARTAPTDSGYGVTPAPARAVLRSRGPPRFPSSTLAPPRSTQSYPVEVTVTPPPAYLHPTSTPHVIVSPNSIDSSTTYDFRPTVPPITASEATSTQSPYDYDSSNTNTIDDGYYASDSVRHDVYNPNSYRHADDWQRRQRPGAKIGDGYTPQFSSYDGVAFRRNGFRYYLPKQYHEEESEGMDERTGSFGYVDPFGIRRVIYYNTAPGEGFQIRKNNRFVGHDATPYDPRSIN